LEFLRRSKSEVVTADKRIASGAGFLLGFKVIPSAAAATALVRDGTSAEGVTLSAYSSIVGEGNLDNFSHPVPFTRGLFVDVGANVSYVFVHYVLEKDLD